MTRGRYFITKLIKKHSLPVITRLLVKLKVVVI